jgi:phosphoglycerol transferase MdoB-like AlkP superfamily enzyme
MKQKLITFFTQHVKLTTYVLCFFVAVRIVELLFVHFAFSEAIHLELFFSRSVNFDLLIVILYSFFSAPLFFLLFLYKEKLAISLDKLFAFIVCFINIGLTQYFLTTNSLLTSQLFEFSFSDLNEIISSELTMNRLPLWVITLVFIVLTLCLLLKDPLSKTKVHPLVFILYGALGCLALFNIQHTHKDLKYFETNYQYQLGNSKIAYFIKSYISSREKENSFKAFLPSEIKENATIFESTFPGTRFLNSEYPFMHKDPVRNVLGPFFPVSDQKPNIVLIISESLSALVSGNSTEFGSLTPFTDSLMRKALSWRYFLSNADRSNGALPNILASAPPGVNERGFINTTIEYPNKKKYPEHASLIEDLKMNNYISNYYYGGWAGFDNVQYYLKEKGVDNLISQDDFDPKKYPQQKPSGKGEIWGYSDKALFDLYHDKFKEHNTRSFFSIIQTISNHSPFNLSDESYYNKKFLKQRLSSVGLSEEIYKNFSPQMVASAFFADDALKQFFDEFKKLPEFSNTIFIITGDHSYGLYSDPNVFKNYWVPLIIYSPLLKKHKEFKGVCSHIDIRNSLQTLLQLNFGLNFGDINSAIGMGLDTSSHFNSGNFIPLNIYAIDKPNFIIGSNVLYGNEIYALNEGFKLSNAKSDLKEKFLQQVNAFLYLNSYVCSKNKIVDPESLAK